MATEPFPFATVEELKARWPDFPPGGDEHAEVLLEDASQFILDICPSAERANERSRRRIVCSVVKRSMSAGELAGLESAQQGAGPYQGTYKPANPHGDFYLTKAERQSLGDNGAQKAFGGTITGTAPSVHLRWCNLAFGAPNCSCGADIAGEPIFEGG
ncbi:hypothetical protein [Arthrobacter rhombi]|uniref:hypothetical protein n=1 Tax=Arthrobacter rhombi TaxID=71253 RepID=UPI003FD28677